MKINKLIFSNINSLKGTFSIDFEDEQLSQDKIFSIIGETGSGKSTLLDAITLAIFSETTRIGKITGTSNELMNRDSSFCSSEVFFTVSNIQYSALFSQNRARSKKDGNLRPYKRLLKDITNNKIIAENKTYNEEINKILNLSFEQFCKSVILPQGDFSKFLTAEDNKKAVILEKITGTEIYTTLSKKIYEHTKEEEKKKSEFELKMGEQKILSKEERKEKEINLEEIEKLIHSNLKKQEKLNLNIQYYKDLDKINNQKNDLNILKEKKENSQENIILISSKLNQNNLAQKPYSINLEIEKLVNEIKIEKDNIEVINFKIKENQLNYDKKIKELKLLEKNNLSITENHKTLKELTSRVKILDSSIYDFNKELLNLKDQKNKVKERIIKLKSNIEQLQKTINEKKKENHQCSLLLENNKNDHKLVENFGEIIENNHNLITSKEYINNNETEIKILNDKITKIEKSIITQDEQLKVKEKEFSIIKNNKNLLKDINHLNKEKTKLENLISKIKENKIILASFLEKERIIQKKKEELISILENKQIINKDYKTAKEIFEKYYESFERGKELLKLKAFIKDLKENKPCPLCGSLSHPTPLSYDLTKFNIEELKLKDKKEKLENKKFSLEQILIKEKSVKSDINSKQKELNKLESSLKNLLKAEKENFESTILIQEDNTLNMIEVVKKDIENYYLVNKQFDEINTEVQILNNNKKNNSLNLKQEISNLNKINFNINIQKNNIKQLNIFFDEFSEYKEIPKRELELKKNLFEKNRNILKTNLELIKSNQIQLNSSLSDLKEEENNLNCLINNQEGISKQLDKIKKQRFELFEDKNCEEEVEKSELLLSNKREEINKTNNKINKLKNLLTNYNSTKLEKQRNLKNKESLLKDRNNELKFLLIKNNFSDIEKVKTVLLTDEEIKKYQKEINDFNSLSQKINILKDQIKKEENNLIKNDIKISFDETVSILEKLKQEYETYNREYGNLEQIIKSDDSIKSNFAFLKEQYDKQVKIFNNWKLLNSLVGSANGDNFRRLAQGITLDYLLHNTNNKLRQLTDRYILSRNTNKETLNSSLDIYVTDLYMNGIKRSCKTLSGGETFLVSLSLALGLSELVNSQNPSQTLFLDEGFGTLDEDTLESSINTLVRLSEKENKQIGIISHVQRIKESFLNQIIVTKKGNGSSFITGPGVKEI